LSISLLLYSRANVDRLTDELWMFYTKYDRTSTKL